MLPVISTARLLLTPFRATDIDRLLALWTEPAVRRFLWDDIVIPRARAAEEVTRGLESEEQFGIGYWIIELNHGKGLAGFCGFRFIDKGPEIELMYGLRQNHWGRGLATEASRAILRWLWESTGHQRVFARTDSSNQGSVALMKRLRMRFESATPSLITYVLERRT